MKKKSGFPVLHPNAGGSLTVTNSTISGNSATSSGGGIWIGHSGGQSSTTLKTDSRYLLTVNFLPNGSGSRTATFVDLKITWPAAASPTAGNTGGAETFIALDRN